ncbi:MAG: hypothetical protein EA427_11960 [Spirochaetaceae bacterium]|nr:MAG: hypothetical protein EA427_11960 [Spirochaetaceae bacterium]
MQGRAVRVLAVFGFVFLLIPGVCLPDAIVAAGGDHPDGPYRLEASLDAHIETAHIRDSLIVLDPEERDTWINRGYGEILLKHHFDLGVAAALIDHGMLLFPGASVSTGGGTGPGTGGTGARDTSEVELLHEVYQANVSILPTPWARVVAGRQFHWEGEGVHRTSPAGLFFSVTDGLHPRSAAAAAQPGFDGLRVEVGVDRPVTVAGAVALQEVLAARETTEGPLEGARYALHGWIGGDPESRLGLTWVGQDETMQRVGIFGVMSPGGGPGDAPGPLRIGLEAAVEMYDPRERVVKTSTLFGIRGEYTHVTARSGELSFFGEYHHNGLAGIYPDERSRVPVTSDGAGAFSRPGRHNAHYGFSLGRRSRWRNTNTFITNLSDESTLGEHKISLLALHPLLFSVAVIWTSGDGASEFGSVREDFILRLTAGFRL